MSYPQYPMQQPQVPQIPSPFQGDERLRFVDGTAGMRAYYVRPGCVVSLFDSGSPTMWLKATDRNGVPIKPVRYHLTEEQDPDEDVGARIAALEDEIRQLREERYANPVPDVRAAAPRHVDTTGCVQGAPDGGPGWQPGGGAAADGAV